MAVSSASVTVPSNAVTLIVAAANANANASGAQKSGRTVTLVNLSANICYIGGSAVDNTGFRLGPTGSTYATVSVVIGQTDALYGLSAANSALVGYIATG